jgi:hypothetical protein
LNLYGGEAGVFSDDSIDVGTILAQHAAVAFVGSATANHFHAALARRDIIGQAKGILMQRENLIGLQAFNLLTRASQETNVKLVDVARWLIEEHEEGCRSLAIPVISGRHVFDPGIETVCSKSLVLGPNGQYTVMEIVWEPPKRTRNRLKHLISHSMNRLALVAVAACVVAGCSSGQTPVGTG